MLVGAAQSYTPEVLLTLEKLLFSKQPFGQIKNEMVSGRLAFNV
jgi:hypothetical protein